jgi:hypothetical protein
MIRFEEARLHHAKLIARDMCLSDIDEVKAGWGADPETAIHMALSSSYFARTLFLDLKPLAIFGLVPLRIISGTACVWVFGTSAIDEHRIAFAKASRVAVQLLQAQCSLMTNLIDESDKRAMKWMFWLGGTVMMPPQIRAGKRFVQFIVDAGRRRCRQA